MSALMKEPFGLDSLIAEHDQEVVLDLEARRHGIGGSDISVILGVNPYKSSYELYLEKVEGTSKDLSNNEKVIWGNLLEEPIAERYRQITGRPAYRCGMQKHLKYPFLLANPDRISSLERRGLEIKAVGEHMKHLWGESGSQQIPEYYYCQMAHYMLVLDFPVWDVAALIGGQELRIYTFQRDKEVDEIIIREASKFWNEHVLKKIPPEKDYANESIQQLIKRKYSLVSEVEVNLPAEYVAVTNQLEEAKEHIKQYEKLRKEAEAMLLDAIGEAGKARLPDGRTFLRKSVERKGYQVEASKYVTLNLRKGA